jgi:hypothetical protein
MAEAVLDGVAAGTGTNLPEPVDSGRANCGFGGGGFGGTGGSSTETMSLSEQPVNHVE